MLILNQLNHRYKIICLLPYSLFLDNRYELNIKLRDTSKPGPTTLEEILVHSWYHLRFSLKFQKPAKDDLGSSRPS